jgi:hypothetical protein
MLTFLDCNNSVDIDQLHHTEVLHAKGVDAAVWGTRKA